MENITDHGNDLPKLSQGKKRSRCMHIFIFTVYFKEVHLHIIKYIVARQFSENKFKYEYNFSFTILGLLINAMAIYYMFLFYVKFFFHWIYFLIQNNFMLYQLHKNNFLILTSAALPTPSTEVYGECERHILGCGCI